MVTTMDIPDNVLRITRHKARGIETEHPAVFPVRLAAFAMAAYSDEDAVVYEPFGGSGTSLVAGQQEGCRVRAIELAPAYIDVALRRWRGLFPDIEPVLDGDRRSYPEIEAARRTAEAAA